MNPGEILTPRRRVTPLSLEHVDAFANGAYHDMVSMSILREELPLA